MVDPGLSDACRAVKRLVTSMPYEEVQAKFKEQEARRRAIIRELSGESV